ncbi:TonB-dependent hemoglobin/transferrin/lactoferrin family receptor [Wenzhouxiangella sp. XN79A]|uniref:TonB-dependent hemoglobin/transferrin/lactoferrin family receptor n=1 Tax=Wenzhouxiangella sp. XN79A TaxID=2724193 RepID=UPI00144A66F0|nr:TonB-dependent hemoglobin/transferrin/lactoferrin family receptor [Wenzhouxiangella sp. XN79A]NKI35714.1 TonB-dependent hemoglobin/transferrin/lactoferrin family receptor [Wenzhouxiangella sp. XN79A]
MCIEQQRTLLWRGLAAALALPISLGAVADSDPSAMELDRVSVSASKTERPAAEIAAPVTIIDDEEIERILAESISDMVRYIPGVTVPFQGQRFGLAGFNIRGLGGNRVQVAVDGVRIPDGFAIGDFTNASRNFIDTDSLKQVEIVRGPASSLFGSDALAGVVALTTKDPGDWLADSEGDFTLRTRAGYYSVDEGWVASGTVAGRNERLSGSLQWVERSGNAFDNQGTVGGAGPTRTEPNPHEFDGRNLLAKVLLDEDSDNQWRLTFERNENESETNVLSLVRTQDFSAAFGFPFVIVTDAVRGDDETRRQRISIDYEARNPGWADFFSWKVYHQDALTRQDTFETRSTIVFGEPDPVDRFRRAEFEQEILGTEAIANWTFETGSFGHDLVAGFEIFETQTTQIRTGFQRSLIDGSVSSTLGPDDFPVRDFPNSTTLEAGLYLEDRIDIGERFKLIPGVRVDYYDLEPSLDAIFIEDNPGFEPVDLDETSVTPRLGAIYALTDTLDVFAQYARGFRAPPYNDVNVGFTNFQFGYTAIPNADLKPEESEGWEIGLRGGGDWGFFNLTAYRNDYEDFIESFVSLGVDPDTGLLVFQSQNLTDVRIEGVEAAAMLNLGALSDRLADFQLRASAAWADGENRSSDVALTSIEPLTGVVGLRWAPANLPVDMELVATAAARKDDVASPDDFEAPGYMTLDLLAGWQINDATRLRAGLFNLTDRSYWAWSTVRGRAADNPGLDRFTQPGFNAGVNLTWQL